MNRIKFNGRMKKESNTTFIQHSTCALGFDEIVLLLEASHTHKFGGDNLEFKRFNTKSRSIAPLMRTNNMQLETLNALVHMF